MRRVDPDNTIVMFVCNKNWPHSERIILKGNRMKIETFEVRIDRAKQNLK